MIIRPRLPIVAIMAAGGERTVERFKAGMQEYGYVEGQNIVFETRVAQGAADKLTGFARALVDLEPDLIAAVGAVTARAAWSATRQIPIVYAVVVEPTGDGLATSSGNPLPTMTGVTTFDADQAPRQIALLRAVKPDLARIAYLADPAVSNCLAVANLRAAQDAGMHAIVVHLAGAEPDLGAAFAEMREDGTQMLVALEHPLLGVHAAQIAEHALTRGLPTLFPRDRAEAGGLLSYGTSLGLAAQCMAQQACRLLGGEAAAALPIETLRRPDLIVNIRTARRLELAIPSELLSLASHVIR